MYETNCYKIVLKDSEMKVFKAFGNLWVLCSCNLGGNRSMKTGAEI